jgi:hypothetical protein
MTEDEKAALHLLRKAVVIRLSRTRLADELYRPLEGAKCSGSSSD